MKKALLILICLATTMAASMGLKAQEVTIMLKPGWTWICYPSADTVDFATALGAFTPLEGDIIACEYDISEYFNGEWMGDIQYFYPGYGYMYYSSRPMPVFLTFNAQHPAPQVVVTTSEPTDITPYSATSGGSITTDAYVFAKGICWATHADPTQTEDYYSENGNGDESFTAEITDLNQNTTYYVRAYAVTQNGIVYGNEVSFTTILEYEYVDLGLPSGTLWATCNVGANAPEEYGDYFAWGETQPKDYYDWNTYQYCNGNYNTLTKYCWYSGYGYNGFTDNLTTLLPEDDAATANWGSDWRMPTEDEWIELYQHTTSTWTTQNGVYGKLFTASNNNSVFLPAGGIRVESSLNYVGSNGNYWSSSLSMGSPEYARSFNYNSYDYIGSGGAYRRSGQSIRPVRSETPTGVIRGRFTSNSNGDQIFFSKGNLQYLGSASNPYWKFTDNQWDYIGSSQNSTSQYVDRDLFGWGTSGYNHGANCYQPWSTSKTNSSYYAYGNPSYNLYDQTGQADWGYNPIRNGGRSGWRTLTIEEWDYLFNTRVTLTGIRYAKAQVNDVNGVILLPDNWNMDTINLSSTNNPWADFSSNTFTILQWMSLESAGVVFLPAAGGRNGTSVSEVGSYGNYWSASLSQCNDGVSFVYFSNDDFSDIYNCQRYHGMSVRLVRNAE